MREGLIYPSSEVVRSFQLALHKRLVDDNLCSHVCQFTALPRLYLLAHRFEVELHPIDPG